MFNDASILACNGNNTVPCPGKFNQGIFYVASTNETPHKVKFSKTSKNIECDSNCPRFNGYKICSHTLAIAEHLDELGMYLKKYRSKQVRPNFARLVSTNMPKGRGRKATQATERRRGRMRQVPVERQDHPTTIEANTATPRQVASPDPMPGSYSAHLLHFCHANVSRCYGY